MRADMKCTDANEIARRRAQEALANIANAQMKTWSVLSNANEPIDFIMSAILGAMMDIGVKFEND